MEDVPEMKWQGLIWRIQVWRTSIVVEQRPGNRQKRSTASGSATLISAYADHDNPSFFILAANQRRLTTRHLSINQISTVSELFEDWSIEQWINKLRQRWRKGQFLSTMKSTTLSDVFLVCFRQLQTSAYELVTLCHSVCFICVCVSWVYVTTKIQTHPEGKDLWK